jgi:predicted lipoprotein with Yx(FWY)xxD motif
VLEHRTYQPQDRSRARRRRSGPATALIALAAGVPAAGLGAIAFGGTALATAPHHIQPRERLLLVDAVQVAKYGKILEGPRARALYYDTANKPPKHWACTGPCLTYWPPLLVTKGEKLTAQKGVSGLGTIKGPSGVQVTWHGKPLYYFAGDNKGTVKGEGVQHVWYVARLTAASTTSKTGGSGW